MGWIAAIWLVAVAETDRRTGLIPNALVGPALLVTGAAVAGRPSLVLSVAVATVPYLIAFLRRQCGGGDVKLAVPCGALAADPLVAALVVVLAAVGTLVIAGLARRGRVRHGPALAGATLVMMAWR
ncbi:A24 family peptidase [Gordonia sp. (in: high G+C Gram-positive bacteria)]|uniref:A24 family peptidase n=1 Tax=Gordonia sp. (in: high G+C Gram-positive bacteria) TaxID=84139 RepID=UPI003C71CEB7